MRLSTPRQHPLLRIARPGVNLRSYVGRQVGITGIRGYMPKQRASHVMARHVSVVEGPQLK